MEEFVSLTVRSRQGENQADFSKRLSHFWTHMLRNRLGDFEQVYAERTAFEREGDCLTRTYLAAEEVVAILERELATAEIDVEPVDRDETYSKYEAVAPEWMQIEH